MPRKEKSFYERVIVNKDGVLNRKDFIISYCIWWAIAIVIMVVAEMFFGIDFSSSIDSTARGIGMGLSVGFVMIFMGRFKYLGKSKWWGALGIIFFINPMLFVYLALKSDKK